MIMFKKKKKNKESIVTNCMSFVENLDLLERELLVFKEIDLEVPSNLIEFDDFIFSPFKRSVTCVS